MLLKKSLASRQSTPWWLWLNILSLDAPIVAMLWQEALSRCYHVKLVPGFQLALGLAVWLIYLVDRTLDGMAQTETHLLSARHAFYRRHRKLFAWVIIPLVTLLLLGVALTEIPSGILWRCSLLALLVGLYLLHYAARQHRVVFIIGTLFLCIAGIGVILILPIVSSQKILYSGLLIGLAALSLFVKDSCNSRVIPKEVVCGFLFAAGCSLGVNFYTRNECASPFSPEILMLAMLFALNCTGISCYERKSDAFFDANAISQTWPKIVRVYPALLLTLAALSSWMLRLHVSLEMLSFACAILLGTLLLAALHLFSRRLRPDLSHVLADVAVALPIIIVMAVQ